MNPNLSGFKFQFLFSDIVATVLSPSHLNVGIITFISGRIMIIIKATIRSKKE